MPRIIDLKKTLDNTNGRITPSYIAKQTSRGRDTITRWLNGGKIPETAMDRLIEILNNNDVEIFYKEI